MCSCGSAVWETLETGEIVSRQSSNQHVTSLGPRTAAGVGSVTCCWPWHLPSSLQERKGRLRPLPAELRGSGHSVRGPTGAGAIWRHCTVRVEELTTRTQLLARGPGAGSQPGGESTDRNTKTGTTQGGRAGDGALMQVAGLGCHGRRAAGKCSTAQPDPADPTGGAPGACHVWLLKV